jgi:hypothetical protein
LLVHIGDPPTNQAASLESQMIPTIQYVPGLALRSKYVSILNHWSSMTESKRTSYFNGLANSLVNAGEQRCGVIS